MDDRTRRMTTRLYEMLEAGLDKDTVITACLKWMSEQDVEDMMHLNELCTDDEGACNCATNEDPAPEYEGDDRTPEERAEDDEIEDEESTP